MLPVHLLAQTLPDDDPRRNYLETIADEASKARRANEAGEGEETDEEKRFRLLNLLLDARGVGKGSQVAVGEFGDLLDLLNGFAVLFTDPQPGSIVTHDLMLEVFDEHADSRGRNPHTDARSPRELDQRTAAPDDVVVDEPPARPVSVAEFEPVLDEVAADETPEGCDVIASVRRLFGLPPGERPADLFKKNGWFNVAGLKRYMGKGAPANRTITRVLRRIGTAAAARTYPTPEPGDLPMTIDPDPTTPTYRPEAAGGPAAMFDGLARLCKIYDHRLNYPHDDALRVELGYLTTRLGRRMSTDVYERITSVDAVAPGQFAFADLAPVAASLRKFLRQVMCNDILCDPEDPLRLLMTALRTGANAFVVGEAAIRSAVALLGLKEYGGVVAAWQLQALGFTLMSWDEHVGFNQRLLAYTEKDIFRESAARRADEFNLPGPDYLTAGLRGNVVNASYRIALTVADGGRAEAARKVGDEYFDELERTTSPGMQKTLLLGGLRLARAACATALGDTTAADRQWSRVAEEDVPQVLVDWERTEPCGKVRARVLGMAREVFRLPPNPDPARREEPSWLELASADVRPTLV